MNTWKQWINKIVSVIVIVSTMVTSAGVVAVRPVAAAEPEPRPGVYLPLRWREQDTDDPGFFVYLPVVMRGYVPPTVTQVNPETGGTLTTPDGELTVTFAPQAVTQTVTVAYMFLSAPQELPAGYQLVVNAFQLTAHTEAGQPVTYFLPQVTTRTVPGPDGSWQTDYLVTNTVVITIAYSDADVAGLDERRLLLHTRASDGDWEPLLTVVDTEANTASAPLNHFSDFALMGVTAVPSDTWVVLDPDHGGVDPGGTVANPPTYAIEEKMVNLDAALAVRDWLADCGVNVLMTRVDDSSVSSRWRADFISSTMPNLAATIAFNTRSHDMGYFVGGPTGVADLSKPEDEDFARLLAHAISDTTTLPDRDVEDADGLYLPTHVTGTLYAQIESAYLDSYNDRDKVIDPKLEYVAGGIYNGIIAQLGLTACVPFTDTITDERHRRTLGIENWIPYDAQGVNSITGNQTQWARDLFVPGVGLNVDLVRYYNSQSDDEGLFGRGWSSSYDMQLDFLDGGVIQVKYADGHRANFDPDGGGYQAEEGVFETLTAGSSGYVLTTPDQVRFTFDNRGVLQSIADEKENTITLHYGGGRLDWIEDTSGRVFDLETDAAGHVTRITDPAGRVVTYTYGVVSLARTQYLQRLRGPLAPSDANQLLSLTDARGGTTAYGYDPATGYLDRITDPQGITYLEDAYTPDGRVGQQQNGNDDTGDWDYDYANMRATFTDNEGNQTLYIFDSRYRVIEEIDTMGNSTTYEYDDHDNRIAMTDERGNTWRYTYDERGNMLTRTDPFDRWSLYDSDVTTWTYDDENNPTSMTDALGNTWTYEYDAQSNPITVTEPNGAVTTAEYDDQGQLLRLTDAEGRITRFEYDEHGNRTKTWDAEGGWTTSIYDDAGHELTRTVCLNPPACTEIATTAYEYDGNGNVTRITDPMGEETTFEYDGNDQLVRKVDRRGGVWEYEYDDELNLTWEQDPLGRVSRYTYDKMGYRLTATDPLSRTTRFEYDGLYRITQVTDPRGNVYRYGYDPNGNLLTLTDPLDQQTHFVYDVVDRRKFVHDAIGGRTEYCYDPLDRIVQVFDPRRAEIRSIYDSVGNQVEVMDPLGNRTTVGYDHVHNRTRLTVGIPSDGSEADGHTTHFWYDGLNREVQRTDPLSRTVHTAYDGVGHTLVVTDARGNAIHFEYDLDGWLTRQTDTLGGETLYRYDAEGATTVITGANDHAVHTDYDLAGQPITVTDQLGAETIFGYDDAGNQIRMTNALSHTTVYTYDELNLADRAARPVGERHAQRVRRLEPSDRPHRRRGEHLALRVQPPGLVDRRDRCSQR